MKHFLVLALIVTALLNIVSKCVATEGKAIESTKTVVIPDLNQPASEEIEETTTKDSRQEPIGSTQHPFPANEKSIEIWRKEHKKEVKRKQRLRYEAKLKKDPVRKANRRIRKKVSEKAWRERMKQSLTPEQLKEFKERKNRTNRLSAEKRKESHYGGFSTRKEQERNRLRGLEQKGELTTSDAEKLEAMRHQDRLKYHRWAQRLKDLERGKNKEDSPAETKKKKKSGL